ncbi:SDR family NAD(P)-dependent oxidoreductase [Streptomyces sp. NEAU-174]|uniref:SDR family NAD(P)-dependent oxidoreductase n=1 Tax=Streptomyces sp. NEAU-174 TaxID=3458254 RepID=UPI004044525F
MTVELENAVVVVIGGGEGIGAAGAIALAAAGAWVVVADIDARAAEMTALGITQTGGQALHVACDISRAADLARLHRTTTENFGAVDVVWAHAGRAVAGMLEKVGIEEWAGLMDLNCGGVVRTFLEFGPPMIDRGHGQLVITSSSLALFPDQVPIAAPYVLTKSALVGLARSLRAYLEPTGVGVTLLCPDATHTRHATEVPLIGLDRTAFDAELDTAKLDKPEDVADALVAALRQGDFFVSLTPDVGTRMLDDVHRFTGAPRSSRALVMSGCLRVNPRHHDRVAAAMTQVVAESRKEPDNLAYAWSADLDQPGVFHLFEHWSTREGLERHAASTHGQAFLDLLKEVGPVEADLHTHEVGATQSLTLPD